MREERVARKGFDLMDYRFVADFCPPMTSKTAVVRQCSGFLPITFQPDLIDEPLEAAIAPEISHGGLEQGMGNR